MSSEIKRKNIMPSNVSEEKLINGEFNTDAININGELKPFFTDFSYDTAYNYVRGEIEVNELNEIEVADQKLKVTVCVNGIISEVEELETLPDTLSGEVYQDRQIDNVFPFNKLCIVTKNYNASDGSLINNEDGDNTTTKGYFSCDFDYLEPGRPNLDYYSGIPSFYKSELVGTSGVSFIFAKNFVKIPRFYLRILFFHNVKKDKYYRRYEIVSPEEYNKIPEELKFGFFVPAAFNNDNYLYVSNAPESFGLATSPFGSETGYFDDTKTYIVNLLKKQKIMTSDVWFGVIGILFKLYVGNLNPLNLLGSDYSVETGLINFDGVNSLLSIYDFKPSNLQTTTNFSFGKSGNKCLLTVNVNNDVFISVKDIIDPNVKNYLITSTGFYTAHENETNLGIPDLKGYEILTNHTQAVWNNVFYLTNYSSSEQELEFHGILLANVPKSKKLFITNLILFSREGSNFTPIYLDVGVPINNNTCNDVNTFVDLDLDYSKVILFDCYYYNPSDVKIKTKYNCIWITRRDNGDDTYNIRMDATIYLGENFELDSASQDSLFLQYSVFEENVTEEEKFDIIQRYLIGNNIVLRGETYLSHSSEEDDKEFFINTVFTDLVTQGGWLRTSDFTITYSNGFSDGEPVYRKNIYNTLDDLTYLNNSKYLTDNSSLAIRFISTHRHSTHPIAGNYYRENKRTSIDLNTKNAKQGTKFTLMYFSNFVYPLNYRSDFSNNKNNQPYSLADFPINQSALDLPYIGNPYITDYYTNNGSLLLPTHIGVLLNDLRITVSRHFSLAQSTDKFITGLTIKQQGYYFPLAEFTYNGTQSNNSVLNLRFENKKLYCDQLNTMRIEKYYDNVIENVYSYSQYRYYYNIPITNDYPTDYLIQIQGYGYKSDTSPTDITKEYIVSATTLQPFFTEYGHPESSSYNPQIIELNLNSLNVAENYFTQNIMLYISGN